MGFMEESKIYDFDLIGHMHIMDSLPGELCYKLCYN